ncbi:MAG: hypothetical protein PVH60_11865 [Anaerolineales bacterium]|jgi:hypothetical protein
MSKMISIHHYHLKSSVTNQTFLDTIKLAKDFGFFDLPGLEHFRFLRGIKGEHSGEWSAIWIYTSRESWEELWGPPSNPKPKQEYPDQWIQWEDELLAPLLAEDPDSITFTSYEEMFSSLPLMES